MNQGKLEVVKQEMVRVNIDNLGISELKWTRMGEFNSDDHYIYYCGPESLGRNGVVIIVNNKSLKCSTWMQSQNNRMDYRESWVQKNWCFWTVELEKTLESALDCREIKPANPKGNQSRIIIGRTDAEAQVPILWPPDAKNWLTGTRHWCWERLKAGGEGDDRGWDGWRASPTQWTWVWVNSGSWWWTGRPGCCSPWGWKESDTTEQLNWTESK